MRERSSRAAPVKQRGSDREALEKIAARVWGSEGPRALRRSGGLDEILKEVERRIPHALDRPATVVKAIRNAIETERPTRFRAFVPVEGATVELGVHVEGRNVRFTHLETKGAPSMIRATEAASLAWESITRELRTFRQVEGIDTQLDGSGRFVHWVRYADGKQ